MKYLAFLGILGISVSYTQCPNIEIENVQDFDDTVFFFDPVELVYVLQYQGHYYWVTEFKHVSECGCGREIPSYTLCPEKKEM